MNYPKAVSLPFTDGVRDVPEHVASALKLHKIPTHLLTYEKAIERMNWAMAERHINRAFDGIVSDHLRNFSR